MRAIALLAGMAAVTPWLPVHAAESRITGNMQVQGSYGTPLGETEDRWALQTPDSWLGVEVVERLPASRYTGVWQFDLDPLAEDPAAGTRQMYLEWRQPLYQVRGGHLQTLERRYLISPIRLMHGVEVEGTYAGQEAQSYAKRAIQLEASSAEVAFISAEWQISNEPDGDTLDQWATATGLNTPEGNLTLLYRNDAREAGLWGLNILWRQAPWSLGGTYLYREQSLSWDLVASYETNAVVTKFGYGHDEIDDLSYWAFGFDQRFSQAITNYTELRWEPVDDEWLWQTGFRLTF